MRPIDADVLIDEIKKDTQKVIKQDDRVGSFWLGYIAGLVIKQPTVHSELDSENLVRTIETGITATNSNDAYSLGMRNGMRWCKSLIDGAEPKFEYGATRVDDGTDSAELPPVPPEPQWISVTERLPDNADHPGAFCPRYQVVTPYGVTEGWYRPHDHEKGGQWFALFWFMSQIYEIWNIDFEKGDVPKVIGEAPVMEWRPLPEPYKPNK